MFDNIRMTVRIAAGILGALWVLAGLCTVVVTAVDHAWTAMLSAGLITLIGFLLTEAAFFETPWERHARRRDEAASHGTEG